MKEVKSAKLCHSPRFSAVHSPYSSIAVFTLLLMKVLTSGKFMAFNLNPVSIMGIAEISTLGKPMKDIVACLTNGGLEKIKFLVYAGQKVGEIGGFRVKAHSATSSIRRRMVPTIPLNSTHTARWRSDMSPPASTTQSFTQTTHEKLLQAHPVYPIQNR